MIEYEVGVLAEEIDDAFGGLGGEGGIGGDPNNTLDSDLVAIGLDLGFIEDTSLGVISGMTAYFAAECREGLMTTIDGGFRLTENSNFLDPAALMKMSLAVTNLMEGFNIVTAYCDFTALVDSLTEIFNFENIDSQWTEYVVLGSRWGGFMINDYWVQRDCIVESWEANVGYDTGKCFANIFSSALDTLL